jgi:hypothetical protein
MHRTDESKAYLVPVFLRPVCIGLTSLKPISYPIPKARMHRTDESKAYLVPVFLGPACIGLTSLRRISYPYS